MLNYSALTDPLTAKDIASAHALGSSMGKTARVVMRIFAIVMIALFVAAALAIYIVNGPTKETFLFLGFIGLSVFAGLITWVAAYRSTRALARINKFALQNGAKFTFLKEGSTEEGLIFGKGHSRKLYFIIDFPSGLRVANYEYVTGYGKSAQVNHWTYARMQLDRHVPNMILDAKSNNLFGRISNLPVAYKRTQIERINAELDKFYTFYTPEGYEQDAYYIFTPDVIEALVDSKGRYDIEIVDDKLYFYSETEVDLSKKESWELMLAVIKPIGKELREQTDYYKDTQAGVSRSADAVALRGQRLRRRLSISAIIIVACVIAYVVLVFYKRGI